jgi:predicted negative regulator of RcsB-dependent stress response
VYLDSAIYQNEDRRNEVRVGNVSHILTSYAFTLLFRNFDDGMTLLAETYSRYPETDSGQFAALRLAEINIGLGKYNEAERLLNSLPVNRSNDKEVKPYANFVRGKLNMQAGDIVKAKSLFEEIKSLPNRSGLAEIEKLRKHANRMLIN